jgi:hypothetical protein
VARIYAGILGPLAMLTSLTRGVIHGDATETVLWSAWCWLLALAAVGCGIGWIAQRTIEESVSSQVAAELAAEQAASTETGQ